MRGKEAGRKEMHSTITGSQTDTPGISSNLRGLNQEFTRPPKGLRTGFRGSSKLPKKKNVTFLFSLISNQKLVCSSIVNGKTNQQDSPGTQPPTRNHRYSDVTSLPFVPAISEYHCLLISTLKLEWLSELLIDLLQNVLKGEHNYLV